MHGQPSTKLCPAEFTTFISSYSLKTFRCVGVNSELWKMFQSFASHICVAILFHTLFVRQEHYYYFQLRTAAFKAYCAIWVRLSNFRHQASPRMSPHEKTQRRKVELWARNVR